MPLAREHGHGHGIAVACEHSEIIDVERLSDPEQHRQFRCLQSPGFYRFDPLRGPADQSGQHRTGHAQAFPVVLDALTDRCVGVWLCHIAHILRAGPLLHSTRRPNRDVLSVKRIICKGGGWYMTEYVSFLGPT